MKTLRISGKAYDAAIAGSQVPFEEGWPVPVTRKIGKGYQMVYQDLDDETASLILWHLDDVVTILEGSSDLDAQEDRRALLTTLEKNR